MRLERVTHPRAPSAGVSVKHCVHTDPTRVSRPRARDRTARVQGTPLRVPYRAPQGCLRFSDGSSEISVTWRKRIVERASVAIARIFHPLPIATRPPLTS